MERMLDQTLAFLRGARADEPVKPVDIGAILQSLVTDMADAGRDVSFEGKPDAVIAGRRLALKRAFANLLDNAVKYGGRAGVTIGVDGDDVSVSIADDGPGIAPGDLERVMHPYVRLEPSRNARTGGFGLGLTIAKAIIEGHGGRLVLQNRPEGGLTAIVDLPRHSAGSA
jgi:signal transduction histidine kinase